MEHFNLFLPTSGTGSWIQSTWWSFIDSDTEPDYKTGNEILTQKKNIYKFILNF